MLASPPSKTLLLVDHKLARAPLAHETVLFWKREENGGESLHPDAASVLEGNWREIRSRYLAWVYDLGRTLVNGEPLSAKLALGDETSLWWVSPIREKSPLKSESIYDVFRLAAAELFYNAEQCQAICYQGNQRRLHVVLEAWAKKKGVSYVWEKTGDAESTPSARFGEGLPQLLQAFLFWVKFNFRIFFQLGRGSKQNLAANPVTVFSYFPNVDLKRANNAEFFSNYWSDLHGVLNRRGPQNWIFFYSQSPQAGFKEAAALRDRFNEAGNGGQFFFIEEFISLAGSLKALGQLFALAFKTRGLAEAIQPFFHFPNSDLNFFELLVEEWKGSVRGKTAMYHLLLNRAFHRVTQEVKPKSLGLFLWEGQSWERLLAVAWKRAGLGRLLGHQHSSLRPLDLRAFGEPREYADEQSLELWPDQLIVNGEGSAGQLRECGFPASRFAIAEAVRYTFLSGTRNKLVASLKPAGRRLLVITDYSPSEAKFQLKLLGEADKRGALRAYGSLVFKPHPYFDITPILEASAYSIPWTKSDQPLSQHWESADVVYCGSGTTASLEAAWLGLPVVISAYDGAMNLCPFYGVQPNPFVRTPQELTGQLQNPPRLDVASDYFELDSAMPKWNQILAGEGHA